ncbi:MAG: permease prefix domain 1-containing protein [Aeromicrobium sp.]|uniref:permease prefix domain 1-containing protein n=1 Tax=Aeromicrobium sp. TaxID=1871063 RepID=UPI0039E4D9CA
MNALEAQIQHWRTYVQRQRTIGHDDTDELEEHLRAQIGDLTEAGLAEDEAFLVAVKRMGCLDAISREFAREHSDRLWKQLVLPAEAAPEHAGHRSSLAVALLLGCCAGAAVRGLVAWGGEATGPDNLSLVTLPFLAAYFAWSRRVTPVVGAVLVAAAAALGLLVNLMPVETGGSTHVLMLMHVPVALWFVCGGAYLGGGWSHLRARMDFVRFTGEWAVYYGLIAVGGGVLTALTIAVFAAVDIDAGEQIAAWVVPLGAGGAVLVAAWLVEAKQDVIENIVPVLTRVFTPLTALMLVAVLGAFVASPDVLSGNRDLLIAMTLILVLVLGLLLYAISARDLLAPADWFDRLQTLVVVLALIVDAVVIVAMLGRIAEFGASPNKVAALGLNLVVAVNLVWSAVLSVRFLRGTGTAGALERWQTAYLPAFGLWAMAVIIVLPPAFGFA